MGTVCERPARAGPVLRSSVPGPGHGRGGSRGSRLRPHTALVLRPASRRADLGSGRGAAWPGAAGPVGRLQGTVPVKAPCPPGKPCHQSLRDTTLRRQASLPDAMATHTGRGAQAAGSVPPQRHRKLPRTSWPPRSGWRVQGPPCFPFALQPCSEAGPQAPTPWEGRALATARVTSALPRGPCPSRPHSPTCPSQDLPGGR